MHAGFLSAILANPDDDQPRLVAADWLEEQGNARGEFIRVQCEIARREDELAKLEAASVELENHDTTWTEEGIEVISGGDVLFREKPKGNEYVGMTKEGVFIWPMHVETILPRTHRLDTGRRVSIFPDSCRVKLSTGTEPIGHNSRGEPIFFRLLSRDFEQREIDLLHIRERELLTPWNILAWTCRDAREMPVIGNGEPQCRHVGNGRVTLTGAYFDAVTFRRGFIESVECGAERWIKHGEALRRLHPVRHVQLDAIVRPPSESAATKMASDLSWSLGPMDGLATITRVEIETGGELTGGEYDGPDLLRFADHQWGPPDHAWGRNAGLPLGRVRDVYIRPR